MAEHGPCAHRKQVGFGAADDEGGSAHRRGDLAVSEQPRPRWLPEAAVTGVPRIPWLCQPTWGSRGSVDPRSQHSKAGISHQAQGPSCSSRCEFRASPWLWEQRLLPRWRMAGASSPSIDCSPSSLNRNLMLRIFLTAYLPHPLLRGHVITLVTLS